MQQAQKPYLWGATSLSISRWVSMLNLVTAVAASISFDRVTRTSSWLREAPPHAACSATSCTSNRASRGSEGCGQTKGSLPGSISFPRRTKADPPTQSATDPMNEGSTIGDKCIPSSCMAVSSVSPAPDTSPSITLAAIPTLVHPSPRPASIGA